jgi:hypothetical protein
MSSHAAEVLKEFEALSPADKQSVAVEILRRTRDLPFDSGPIADEEIGEAGRSLFAFLISKRRMPPRRGEIWLFDLGMAAKTRPVPLRMA